MKAHLVTLSFTYRIVAENEQEAIGKAIDKYAEDKPYIGYESVEKIEEDTENPYDPEEVATTLTPQDITVTPQHNGLELSTIYNGERRHKLYMGYDEDEAKELFIQFVTEQ